MKTEYKVSIDELSEMIGAAPSSVRTWISSYKFARHTCYDGAPGAKQYLCVVINKEFCRDFIPYLTIKDVKKKRNYVKNFNKSIARLI